MANVSSATSSPLASPDSNRCSASSRCSSVGRHRPLTSSDDRPRLLGAGQNVCVPLLVLGLLFIAVAGVLAVADSGDLAARLPTQVVPRRLLKWPAAMGAVLGIVGLVLAVMP